jgi:uncharacterized membrane protein YhaH (DUF805 family)
MTKLINYIQSSFINWIDFKSRISRIEFFTGLVTSGLFLLLNILVFIQLNSYSAYLRMDTLNVISVMYIFIAIFFAFIQSHSLVARRLNDIKVNPYFAFVPFILSSVYLLLKVFVDTDPYGKFIFISILLVILVTITLLVSESD